MAPKKRSTPSRARKPSQKGVQSWYTRITTDRARLARERELREKLRVARAIFSGFDSYNARYPRYWTHQQRRSVEQFARRANALLAVPSLIVKPKNSAERLALQKHTGQMYSRQIRFAVHVAAPKRMRIRFVHDRARVPFMAAAALKLKTLRVEVVDKVKGGEMYTQDFLFREILGFQPVIWTDFIDALIRLLPYLPDTTPSGEESTFTLMTLSHGPVSSPVLKSLLLEEMQRWSEEYSNSFSGVLIGVRYQGDTFRSFSADDSEYNRRQDRRSEFRRIREDYVKAAQRWNEEEFQRRLRALREARGLVSIKNRKKKRVIKKKRILKPKRTRVVKKKRVVKKRSPRRAKRYR